jgi:hypothetical protein
MLLAFCCWLPGTARAQTCSGGCNQVVNGTQSGAAMTTVITVGTAGDDLRIWTCALGSISVPSIVSLLVDGSSSGVTIGSNLANGGSLFVSCSIAVYPNATAATHTIVVTYNQAISNFTLALVEEWTGDATTSVFDGQAATYANLGDSTSAPCGSFTTTVANDSIEALSFAFAGYGTIPTGFSNAVVNSPGQQTAYKASNVVGTYNPTYTTNASGGPADTYIICAAFKPLSAVTSPPIRSLMGVGK